MFFIKAKGFVQKFHPAPKFYDSVRVKKEQIRGARLTWWRTEVCFLE
jgi:hypothetical protein